MADKPQFRRKQHFIKKGFQLNFSVRFLALIIIEAVLLAGIFWYVSLNTLTTSYQGAQLRIENTSSFFFPSMMYPVLVVIGVVCIIGIVGLIFISHKIAGPLYRFEKSLKEIGEGNLTCRVALRQKDQLSGMADALNNFTSDIEKKVLDMKLDVYETGKIMGEMQPYLSSGNIPNADKIETLFADLTKRHTKLKDTLEQFRTSQDLNDHDSKGREA
jgi:methyl-accepting chemotaxis protein